MDKYYRLLSGNDDNKAEETTLQVGDSGFSKYKRNGRYCKN